MLAPTRAQVPGGWNAHGNCLIPSAGRHPDYIQGRSDPLRPAVVQDRPFLEADVRYRRTDFSAELQREARREFAACLAAGEAQLELARAALLVAAEDDAISSSSTVRFPVDAFLQRITQLASDTAQLLDTTLQKQQQQQRAPASSSSSSSSDGTYASLRAVAPHELVAAVEHCLFKQQQEQQHQQEQQAWYASLPSAGFSMPAYGRSNLPRRALIDHPGVWEDARLAYLNEALVRRRGCPAALVILYCEVMRQLLALGAVDFAVTFDCRGYSQLPRAQPLARITLPQLTQHPAPPPGSGSSMPAQEQQQQQLRLLNTCSSDALAELLRHLKRAYWPFPWDTSIDSPYDCEGRGSLGGFRAAAKAALGSDELPAALRAVSATAAHRLSRGIWTSPGAGDLNRCLAAAERLVMMVGDEQPQERRDLGVLLLHAGRPTAAAAELSAYLDAVGKGGRLQVDPFDARLVGDLVKMIRDSGIQPDSEVMSVETVLRQAVANARDSAEAQDEGTYKPLTW